MEALRKSKDIVAQLLPTVVFWSDLGAADVGDDEEVFC